VTSKELFTVKHHSNKTRKFYGNLIGEKKAKTTAEAACWFK